MKLTATLSLILALSTSSLAIAMEGMEMKDKGMEGMEMKDKGMEMKDKGMEMNGMASKATVHQATGVVKAVDAAKGKVKLAHDPIKSLKLPAMTMDFAVKDKMLFDRLVVGKKVNVEIMQQGSDYVVTAVK